MNITKTAARAELARRKLPKGDAARKNFPAPAVMKLSGPELRAIADAPARKRMRLESPTADVTAGPALERTARKPKATARKAGKPADPVKRLAAEYATACTSEAARGTSGWWAAYREFTAMRRAGEAIGV